MQKAMNEPKKEKFPHKGRAGYLARKKLAEQSGQRSAISGKPSTGWGRVADWYHETVEDRASYQRDLIMPNLLRLMDIKKGQKILDLGCGEGLFTRRFARAGAEVVAIDISKELIEIAQRASAEEGEQYAFHPRFFVSDAANIPMVASGSQDMVLINLALQNIQDVTSTLKECARVLKVGGQLFIVLNHPAFRGIKSSDWSWDIQANSKEQIAKSGVLQMRRVWRYMSESREKIDMAPSASSLRQSSGQAGRVPGEKGASEKTVSFNRPLQFYFKQVGKAGMAVINMEEWVSNKKSQPGPRAGAENMARQEIPLFMALQIKKM